MFFKRLEIIGFKSFATKTTVEFLPGVTVIVGPNGCGKSNVFDAIKWVLGTQSAKSLRGKHMSDVIFAGSASFKPLGVAQVTLTINNEGRLLDIDYDEVQITRRLFRTGESEYLLNKVPCRLRDIHDLLLGTGAGTLSYSILEQGKVDQIINAKPEERRYIFEEAAGISKYKARRMEAVRKLERTTEDLARLHDLISEVDRQVASLKRQAGKAERYREYSEQLRQFDMELMVLRSRGLRGQLDTLQAEINALRDRGAEYQAQIAERSAAEEERKTAASDVDQKLNERTGDLYQVSTRVKDLEHQSGRAADRIRGHERRIEQIEGEFAQFDARTAELARRQEEAEARRAQAAEEAEAARAAAEELGAAHGELRGRVDEKTRLVDELGRRVARLREELSRLENSARMEEALIARNEENRREAESIIERLAAAAAEQAERRDGASVRLEEAAFQIEEARASSSSLQIRHAETHSRIADLNGQLDQTRRELHQRSARLSTLKELKSNFEGFYQGVREVMKSSARGELKGVVGPVVNLIKSTREAELAIEVALGSQLQDVIVESAEAARAALEFLIVGEQGRVTFLPLDRITNEHVTSPTLAADLPGVLAEPGVVGHAPALVDHDPQIASVVTALLANTIVVENFEAAERLSARHGAFRYVALNGLMIHATGAVTGGNQKSSGLLGREREIHELTEAVATLSASQEDLQGRVQSERETADRLTGEIKACTGQLHELELQKARLDKEAESAERQHADSQRQLAQRREQHDTLSREIEERGARKARMEAEQEGRRAELEEAAAQADGVRDEARAENEEFIVLGQRLAEARGNLGKATDRMAHLDESLRSIAAEAAVVARDRDARAGETARLREDCAQAEQEIARVREDLDGLFARRAELERELAADRAEKDELAAALKSVAHEIEQIRRDQRVAENELHELQVRHAELQGSLNNLCDQAREKFDRDLFEIASEIGELDKDAGALAQEVAQLRQKIDRMGPVNLAALEEYNEQNSRLQFLQTQETDLAESKAQIEATIGQLDETTKRLFHETFESVRGHFIEMFRRLFNGGKADLVIDQNSPDPLLEGGVEIFAQPPGKKLQTMSLMSGGEKAMTAVSLLFALFLHKPAPFAILDEIDAPLDDANVERFKSALMDFSKGTQFVIITHNKLTMELADAIYGVTMEESGVSKLVSVRFEQALEHIGSA